MSHDYVYRTERMVDSDGTELIVQLVADTSGLGDPREYDNFTEIFGESRSLDLTKPPSEHIRVLERIGLVGLHRFMRRFGDPRDGSKLLAIKQLDYYEHSGITVYTAEVGTRNDYVWDPGGWDTSHAGYIIITQKRWDEMGGGNPDEAVDGEVTIGFGRIPVKMTRAYAMLDAEINEWDDWIRGNVWGLVATKPCLEADEHADDEHIASCPHAETIESTWGYIGDPDDAWKELTADFGFKSLDVSVTA